MQGVLSGFAALSAGRQAVVLGAGALAIACLLALFRIASAPSLSLLYSGLDPAAAGDIVQSLDAQGVIYEIRGESIYVEAARRDELRLALASEGKPANGPKGYELLDSLSGFGTTSQMFDAAYWRAKEGELARTILVSPQITSARVHISNATRRPFGREETPTASVSIATGSGGLSAPHARALRFLVASAVAGLDPENVSIIDIGTGELIDGVAADGTAALPDTDMALALRERVERLLEARVGYGSVVVEVNVEHVMDREQIVERRFDPDSRVAISTDTEERGSTSTDTRAGAVTVASNLPEGDAAGTNGQASSQNTETRERVNYEVSETQRELVRVPGAIKRLTVAVLVDGIRTVDATSGEATWERRSEAELESLRDLVASAVGFDGERGDSITIQSMEFELPAVLGTEAAASGLGTVIADNLMRLVQLAVFAAVALVLGLFVVRPILASPPAPNLPQLPAAAPSVIAGPAPGEQRQIAPPPAGGEVLPALAEDAGGFADLGFDFSGSGMMEPSAPDPAARLRTLIENRQSESVEIIRGWMEGRGEPA